MFITPKINVILPLSALVVLFWLYGSLPEYFGSEDGLSENATFSTNASIRRKLLAVNPTANENSHELQPYLNTLYKEKLDNDEKHNVFKNLFSYSKPHENRMKKLSRRKRETHHNDFGWKLSLNVTNNKNPSKAASNLASVNDLLSTHEKGKFLNMAVQMEGASPDNSFKDLHHSWDSLGFLLRRVYGKHASFKNNARDNSFEISTEPNDIVQSDIPPEKPGRERTPKLIFGFFNPKTSENPPEDVTTHKNEDSSESVTSSKMNTTLKKGLTSPIVPLRSNTTEFPIEAFRLTESISVEPTIAPIIETFSDFESTSSEFNTKVQKPSDSSDNFKVKITTIKPDNSFTSDQLKEFCISLLSRIHVSPKSGDNFPEDDGSGEPSIISMGDIESMNESPTLSTETSEEVTTKSTTQIFGIWASIWNRFSGRRMVQLPSEDNLQLTTLTEEHDSALLKQRNNGDDLLGLIGESSTNLDNSDSAESDLFDDEDESALTVPDCEHFFRHMQNDDIFSKPNLLDIINNPMLLNLHPSEFNFTEVRDDKQMRSMRSGLDSMDSNTESNILQTEEAVNNLNIPFSSAITTVKELADEISVNELFSEQSDKNRFKVTVSSHDALSTSSFIDDQESFQTEENDNPNIDNLIAENEKNIVTEVIRLSDKFTTVQTKSSSEILSDRSPIQSDIRARTDKTSEMSSVAVSTNIDERIFGILNFGSGERSLEDSDSLATESASEVPENRSFSPDLISFASGDTELNEALSDELEITSTDSTTVRSIFDVILSLRKEESRINTNESDTFVINEANQFTEGISTMVSVENPNIELQFDPKEKRTENQNSLNLANNPPTQSILDDLLSIENAFDGTTRIEFQLKPEESTESQNVILESTHLPIAQSLSEDSTLLQNVLEDGNTDEDSRIFPGLLNVFGSGDGREMSEISTEPEIIPEFSECLDCFRNQSSSFSDSECIDCESNTNGTVPLISDNRNSLDSSTDSLEILTPSHTTGVVSHEHHDTSENIGSEGHMKSNSDDIGYDVYGDLYNYEPTDYGVYEDHSSKNSGYEGHKNDDNNENNGYDGYEYHYYYENTGDGLYDHQDNTKNIGNEGYKTENNGYVYELHDGFENNNENTGYDGYEHHNENTGYGLYDHQDNTQNIGNEGYKTENNGYVYEPHDGSENTNYAHEYHDNSATLGHEVTSFQPLELIHVEGDDVKMEFSSENPTEDITSKDRRFLDTLFLTGSGAGGLFGNDNGEINLVPEPDTTSFPFPVSPRQSRRGSRRDDVPFDHTWPTEQKQHVSENKIDIPSQNESEDPKLNSQDKSREGRVLIPEEVEKFNIDAISPWTTFRSIHGIDEFNHPGLSEYTTQSFQDGSKETVTAISIPASSFVIPKKKAKDLPPKYCNHAGECDIALNEGCVTKKGHGLCDCRRSFVRDPETDICEAPFMLKTSLKLPQEAFHQDLRDKYSELYRNKTRDAIDTMWLIVYQDPTLEENIADVQVAGFEEGSLVVHWELIFAVKKNESISEIVQEVDDKLKEAFKHRALLQSAPLNVENAKLLSVSSDMNPCDKKELNYCSKYAECIRDEYRGFKCRCKEGYLDNSKHQMYPGEICIATCPQDFCGENGYCEVRLNGEKQCLCNGWYFGDKCNVSGILIISCFAGANCVLIAVVVAIVCCCKRRRQRRARFYENNQIMFQSNQEMCQFGDVSPRLAASIAHNEKAPAKASKYMTISTPLSMVPDIQITSPSILGSSISYDYDSTFDRTPSAEINMEPPKYGSIPEVPKYDSVPEV